MSDSNDAVGMRPPVTPREVVDALDTVIRWCHEDTTGQKWRVDVRQVESDRESMARLVWPELNNPVQQDEGPPVDVEDEEDTEKLMQDASVLVRRLRRLYPDDGTGWPTSNDWLARYEKWLRTR